jgi:predicted PurR-regulated permease PerM
MIVMEAAFGIAGLIAAPIYYAYIKNELSAAAVDLGLSLCKLFGIEFPLA